MVCNQWLSCYMGKYPQPLRWSARIRSGSKGYHTTIDTVKGATGATAGDALNHVSYAMRGFQGNQINVTYNGINIGPTALPR